MALTVDTPSDGGVLRDTERRAAERRGRHGEVENEPQVGRLADELPLAGQSAHPAGLVDSSITTSEPAT